MISRKTVATLTATLVGAGTVAMTAPAQAANDGGDRIKPRHRFIKSDSGVNKARTAWWIRTKVVKYPSHPTFLLRAKCKKCKYVVVQRKKTKKTGVVRYTVKRPGWYRIGTPASKKFRRSVDSYVAHFYYI